MLINRTQSIVIFVVSIVVIATFIVLGTVLDRKTPEDLTTEPDSVIFEEAHSEPVEEESSEPVVTTEKETEPPTIEKATSKVTEPVTKVEVDGYFNVPLSTDLQDHIFSLCTEYGVDPAIVVAIIEKESTYNPDAVNYNGTCHGLMQVYKYYHTSRMARLGVTNLYDPYQNVKVGIDILAELYSTGNSTTWVLTSYSGGARDYASAVINRAESLRASL